MFQITVSPTTPKTLNFSGPLEFQEKGTEGLHLLRDVIVEQMIFDFTRISKWDETSVLALCNEIDATGKEVNFVLGPKDAALCLKLSLFSESRKR